MANKIEGAWQICIYHKTAQHCAADCVLTVEADEQFRHIINRYHRSVIQFWWRCLGHFLLAAFRWMRPNECANRRTSGRVDRTCEYSKYKMCCNHSIVNNQISIMWYELNENNDVNTRYKLMMEMRFGWGRIYPNEEIILTKLADKFTSLADITQKHSKEYIQHFPTIFHDQLWFSCGQLTLDVGVLFVFGLFCSCQLSDISYWRIREPPRYKKMREDFFRARNSTFKAQWRSSNVRLVVVTFNANIPCAADLQSKWKTVSVLVECKSSTERGADFISICLNENSSVNLSVNYCCWELIDRTTYASLLVNSDHTLGSGSAVHRIFGFSAETLACFECRIPRTE